MYTSILQYKNIIVQDPTVSDRLYYKSSPATNWIIQWYVRMSVSTNICDKYKLKYKNKEQVASRQNKLRCKTWYV